MANDKEQPKDIVLASLVYIIYIGAFIALIVVMKNYSNEEYVSERVLNKAEDIGLTEIFDVKVIEGGNSAEASRATEVGLPTEALASSCEIVMLKSTTLVNTEKGVKLDAHTNNSKDSTLLIPDDKLYLVKTVLEVQNTETQSLFEVCHKGGIISELKHYPVGIK